MTWREDAARVRFSLQLARQAFSSGAVPAARVALKGLDAGDFAGGPAVSAAHLAVLRDPRASDTEVREAIGALVSLRPG